MICGNVFCIYWENERCTLNQITLDDQGKCEACIYVEIDPALLSAERERLLCRYTPSEC